MSKARTVGIWISGLLGTALLVGILGNWLDRSDGGFVGFAAGLALFTCIRLWLRERKSSMIPVYRMPPEPDLSAYYVKDDPPNR